MSTIWETSKGITLYVDTGFNLSSATNVEIHFSAPGISTVNSASVSVLAANVTTSACGVFSANKAVEYITNSGDFSFSADRQSVTCKGWIVADFDANTRLISSTFKFKVCKPG